MAIKALVIETSDGAHQVLDEVCREGFRKPDEMIPVVKLLHYLLRKVDEFESKFPSPSSVEGGAGTTTNINQLES